MNYLILIIEINNIDSVYWDELLGSDFPDELLDSNYWDRQIDLHYWELLLDSDYWDEWFRLLRWLLDSWLFWMIWLTLLRFTTWLRLFRWTTWFTDYLIQNNKNQLLDSDYWDELP